MLIKNIESKVRLASIVSVGSFLLSFALSVTAFFFAYRQVGEERRQIYVLNAQGLPQPAYRRALEMNRSAEYRAHISRFHELFFSLIPDEKYIEQQMSRAMYLVDESGVRQYNNLKEKSFFNSVLSSSAVLSLQIDSILLDEKQHYFRLYATQRIDRRSLLTTRSLITEGHLVDLPARSEHNPHAVLITGWKTLENADRSSQSKDPF